MAFELMPTVKNFHGNVTNTEPEQVNVRHAQDIKSYEQLNSPSCPTFKSTYWSTKQYAKLTHNVLHAHVHSGIRYSYSQTL